MRNPFETLPASAFWKTGVKGQNWASIEQLYTRKFPIETTTRIMTAGSCFAQHIGKRLKASGFTVLDTELPPQGLSGAAAQKFGYQLYSARYGNIYTIRQFLQLLQEAHGRWTPGEVVWPKGSLYTDALRPNVEPEGLESPEAVLAHRASHLKRVRRAVARAELVVFTFGLTEAWLHRASGTVFPIVPGTSAGGVFDAENYVFHNFTSAEVQRDFIAVRAFFRRRNPNCRFLVTVSPVPLTATASGRHVLSATVKSKAILRAVAGQLEERFEDVDYFPSFELIFSPFSRECFYDLENLREVRPDAVDMVMKTFLRAHAAALQPGAEPIVTPQTKPAGKSAAQSDGEVVCEEILLEAFKR